MGEVWAAQTQGVGAKDGRWRTLSNPSPSPLQPGVPAFTVVQPDGSLAVLRDRAQQISVSLIGGAGWGDN